MKKIILNKRQAKRIKMPQLEGKMVELEMPTREDVEKGWVVGTVAKNVYHQGKRIIGIFDITG